MNAHQARVWLPYITALANGTLQEWDGKEWVQSIWIKVRPGPPPDNLLELYRFTIPIQEEEDQAKRMAHLLNRMEQVFRLYLNIPESKELREEWAQLKKELL